MFVSIIIKDIKSVGVNEVNNETLKHMVKNKKLDDINLPNYLSIDDIKHVLYQIIEIKQNEDANVLANQLFKVVGNQHQGVYFSIVDDVIDILEIILEHSQNHHQRKLLILAILNDLYYFDLDEIAKQDTVMMSKNESIKCKLEKYSDENFSKFL